MDEMRTVTLQGRPISYRLRPSRRARRLSLRISLDSGLVVVHPQGVSPRELPRFLQDKSRWIARTLDRFDAILRRAEGDVPLDKCLFMGVPYDVRIVESTGESNVEIRDGSIVLSLARRDRRRARRILEAWYRRRAEEVIVGLAREKFAGRILIRDQKSKWGACSSRGTLSFNWRLILAPLDVIRYVVVHERCHLSEFNHTPRFWELVAEECPDYKRLRAWLRTRGPLLSLRTPKSV